MTRQMQIHHKSPEQSLLAEEAMVDNFQHPDTRFALEFWTTDQCLIVPKSLTRVASFDSGCAELRQTGWPVVVRKTGGGITPHGQGTLNLSLAFALDPAERPSITGVYEMFCAPLLSLMAGFGCDAETTAVPGSFCDGAYNIAVNGKKVMGTAQRWTRVRSTESRQVVFAHALILVNADIASGVQAVNRLSLACGLDNTVRLDKHANILELVQYSRGDIDQNRIVSILGEAYLSELDALTG